MNALNLEYISWFYRHIVTNFWNVLSSFILIEKTYGKIMRYTIILGFTIRIGEGDLRFEYRRGLLINYYIYFMNNNV